MDHPLSTANPEVAERLQNPQPLPGIGETVIYQPRPGERRRGRAEVAAIVLYADPQNGLLDLMVFNESADMLDQPRVPEVRGDDRGWKRRPAIPALDLTQVVALRTDLDALTKMVLGDFEMPDVSVIELLDAMDERLGKIEDAAKTPRGKAQVAQVPQVPKAPRGHHAAALVAEEPQVRRRFGRG